MAIIKCTVCGGELEVNSDLTVGKCKYCESTILIPKNLERKGNLYNRAIFLRQNNEFDKAAAIYEDILKEDNEDPDAHWGLVLCKYGIEYVKDPRDGKMTPTCHRTQAASILSDSDYKAALQYSDFEAARTIKSDAECINNIQKKILEIAKSEPPYDVFICYKESDELGNRTKDSIIAQDLYYELTKLGHKVFFARKTLKSKLGREYEPIIYAALSSAPVMVVLGTTPENFNSVWVKNEWSRYLKMNKERRATLIPAYKDMSPYELPDELANLQALDMNKIGFLQELTDGIQRLLPKPIPIISSKANKAVVSGEEVLSLERLLENGETFLDLKDYRSAENSFRRATEVYPQDYHGWWGLIRATTYNLSFSSRKQNEVDIWYDNIRFLCPEKEYSGVKNQYLEYLKIVAKSDAATETSRVNAVIVADKENVLQLQKRIGAIEQIKRSRTSNLEQSLSNENSTLEQLKRNVTETQNKLTGSQKKRPVFVIGVIISGLWLLTLIIQVLSNTQIDKSLSISVFIIAIFLIGASIRLFSRTKGPGIFEKQLFDAQESVNQQIQKIANLNSQHQLFIKSQDAEIASIKNEIAAKNDHIFELEQQLCDCANILDDFFYCQRCKRIGVTVSSEGSASLPWLLPTYEHDSDI